MDKLLYGVAYYDEYMPYDRLAEDVKMMKAANINVVRIAESTWSTHEPQEGVFDFPPCDTCTGCRWRRPESNVIVGTPTYAIPTWMVKAHPDILADDRSRDAEFTVRRQIMDITHPAYLFYAERDHSETDGAQRHTENVSLAIQLDNETKYYGHSRTPRTGAVCQISARKIP